MTTPTPEPPFRIPGLSPSTPLKQAARDLSAGLHTILEHSPTAIFVKRVPDWRYLLVNRTFETVFRLRREDVIGRRDEDFLPANVVQGVRVLDEEVLATGESRSAEEYVPHFDGSLHTYLSVKFPLRNSKGEIYAVGGMATDITDRKRGEDAVQAILRGTSTGTGKEFLRSLVLELSGALGARWAYVGKLIDSRRERIRTVALADSGKIVDNFEYDLKGTPCANVVGKGVWSFPSSVARQFPEDLLLCEMGVEAYLGIPLWDSNGSPLGLLVVLHDRPMAAPVLDQAILKIFASRAGSEIQRLESESRWNTLVESCPQVILQIDRSERIRFFNRPIPPLTAEQIQGALFHTFIPESNREIVRSKVRGVFETGRLESFESEGPGPGGVPRWYEATVGPVFEEGVISSVILIASDIHERRRASEELRASEARWRTLVESDPGAVVVFDSASRRFTDCNENALRLFGYSREELLTKGPLDLSPPSPSGQDPLSRLDGMIERVLAGEIQTFEWIHRDARGREFPCEVRLVKLPGDRPLIRGSLTDITERKTAEADRLILEEKLVQAQKMDAIGRLAGGVAHDFNNLLTVIQGHLALLQGSLTADNPLRNHVDTALQASQSATGLTKQLLMFSRKSIQNPVVLELNAVLRDQHAILRRLIGEHIDLDIRPSPEPCFIRCDVSQIHQVILNLAVNARDAMPAGGRLSILTRQASRENLAVVELEVVDTGTGIPPEVLPRIFEPFFTTKETGVGTGLGLSLVHGLITQAGGSIQVQSQVGKGTRFLLQFPLAQQPAQPPMAEKTTGPVGGRESILVVEDDRSVRHYTSMILTRSGYQVQEASHGAEALQILERPGNRVDFLLTDIVMPGMNGRQLAEAALRLRPELRVLYVTGYTDDEIVHHGVHASHIELLEKPFTSEALLTRIRRILDRPAMGRTGE